jgi:hypothetical protein
VVDDHVVYVFLLFGRGAFGSDRILGVDRYLEETDVVWNNRWLGLFPGRRPRVVVRSAPSCDPVTTSRRT